MTSRLKVVVLGYVVRGPLGGLAWHHLQYVAGLARLGHDVYFVEDSDDYPSCYHPPSNTTGTDPQYGLEFAERAFGRLGLGQRWTYFDAHTGAWMGPCAPAMPRLARDADLLLNISGVNPLRTWAERIRVRVLVDTDPVFTQVRHLSNAAARERARAHNCFLTFGENFGEPGCSIPEDGLDWLPTRQPVVPELWPVRPAPPGARFTTVMQWESYRAAEYGGRHFEMKSESFRPFLDLPAKAAARFEIALGSSAAPRDDLRARGWRLRDPRAPTRDPWTYQRYIRRSRGEFSVAKHGYVVTNSGWFSERSAAYLASGRPAIVQDTGFTRRLPCGIGLMPFRTVEDVLAALDSIGARYERHCQAAREIAEAHFDYRDVLGKLLDRAFAAAPATAGACP